MDVIPNGSGHMAVPALLLAALTAGGCSTLWPSPPPPVHLWAEQMLHVCAGHQRRLDGWPGARVMVDGEPEQVLAASRAVLAEQGYVLAEDRPERGCLKTALAPVVDDGTQRLPDLMVTGLPKITEHALAVLATRRAGRTQLEVWRFPKAGELYVAGVSQPLLSELPKAVAAAIKSRVEHPPQPSPSVP
jgi:hypothetical protein